MFYRPRRMPERRGGGLLASAVLGVGLALLCIFWINEQMMPIFASMASTRVQNVMTQRLEQTINDYITGQNVTYQDMVTLEKDENGNITALTSNMSRLNALRNGILLEVSKSVETVEAQELSLPAGNLTGLSFLSGRGFALPVRIVSLGTAKAEFRQSFSAAGINQTHHQIMLSVTVTVSVLLPGETLTTQVETEVCAAETVIVGSVPQTYLQLNQ